MRRSEDEGQMDLANAMESALEIWLVQKRRYTVYLRVHDFGVPYTEVVCGRATAASAPDELQGAVGHRTSEA